MTAFLFIFTKNILYFIVMHKNRRRVLYAKHTAAWTLIAIYMP